MLLRNLPLVLCISCVTQLANAGSSSKAWSIDAELGLVSTSGNTETQTINAKLKATKVIQQWERSILFETLSATDNDETSAERYLLSGQSDYKLQNNDYLFVLATYDDDRFSGFEYQATLAGGYGWNLIEQEALVVDIETGLGYRQSKLEAGETENEAIVHLGGFLDWEFSKTAAFHQSLVTDIGQDSTISKSVSALKTQMAEALAMKLSFTIKHTSDVPATAKKTETETAATIIYSF